MTNLLDRLLSFFDFAGRRELRRLEAQRLADEAERQRTLAEAARYEQLLELVEVVMTKSQETNAKNVEALIEVAKGVQAHGAALNTWFDTFKAYQGDGDSVSQVEADDLEREHQKKLADEKEMAELKAKGYPVDGDPQAQASYIANLFAGFQRS